MNRRQLDDHENALSTECMKNPVEDLIGIWGCVRITQEVGVKEIRRPGGVGRKQRLSFAFSKLTKSKNNLLECSFYIYGGLIFLSKPRYVNR